MDFWLWIFGQEFLAVNFWQPRERIALPILSHTRERLRLRRSKQRDRNSRRRRRQPNARRVIDIARRIHRQTTRARRHRQIRLLR